MSHVQIEKRPERALVSQMSFWQAIDEEFNSACAQGRSSAWDSTRKVPGSVDSFYSETPELLRLQRPTLALMAHLPGLVAEVRALREADGDAHPDLATLEEATKAVDDLLSQQDLEAESQVLHQVRILPTSDPSKRAVMSSSYAFRSFDAWILAMHYWYLRLIAIKLRLVLDDRFQPSLSDESAAALRSEQIRLVANVLMAYPSGPYGAVDARCGLMALVVLWGALSGMTAFRAMPAGAVRSWVLRAGRELLGREVDIGLMDGTSGLLEGGPRVGLLMGDTNMFSTDVGTGKSE
jgi:hypothetical protein